MKCNWCSTIIFFNNGEKIPREIDTGVMYKCILRNGKLPCLYCDKEIFFTPFVTSRSGKPIPLSVASGGGLVYVPTPGIYRNVIVVELQITNHFAIVCIK